LQLYAEEDVREEFESEQLIAMNQKLSVKVFLLGAGISPYRGRGGLWTNSADSKSQNLLLKSWIPSHRDNNALELHDSIYMEYC
jgi:hypothetical protein